MNPPPLPLQPVPPEIRRRRFGSLRAFTIIELLTVMAVIAIIVGIAAPLIPSLLRGNQTDSSIVALTGILEQARGVAVSQNTYVWVAFTSLNSTPANGIWVATFQSMDGTEAPINYSSFTNSWVTTNITIPSYNLQLVNKIQNLRGIQVVDAFTNTLPSYVSNSAVSNGAPTASVATPFSTTNITITPNQYTEGWVTNASASFGRMIEFCPDGQARNGASTWYNHIQFAVMPSIGSQTNNSVYVNISRVTGKATFYRP